MKESDLYASIKTFIRDTCKYQCVITEAGGQGIGYVDVFGARYRNARALEIETVGVERSIDLSVKSKTREGRLRTGEIFKACEGSSRNSLFFRRNQMDFARLSSLFDSSLEVVV